MAPNKVLRIAAGRPVEQVPPAANPEASRRASPPVPADVAAPKVPPAGGQGAWAWASDELQQKLRAVFRDEARSGEASPARKFGAGFGFGAIGLGDKLGVTRYREIEKLTTRVEELEKRQKPRGDRGGNPGTSSVTGRRRTPKKADIKLASRRLKQLQKEIINELKSTRRDVGDAEVQRELLENIFRRSRKELTAILHERYGYPLNGDKTLSRTPEFISWKQYRSRGNAHRLDPENHAIKGTACGGVSSRSGRSREKEYADANDLRVTRFGKIRDLDPEAERQIAADPDARRWLEENASLLDEPTDSQETLDNR